MAGQFELISSTLRVRPMANATPYGETSAAGGKAVIRAGLTRYLGRETLIKYWLPYTPTTPGASSRETRPTHWLPLHPYTPVFLQSLKAKLQLL
ncbi:MAG: hypothetical protein KME46_07495 [Brasilonema angustatum HA4187-MV1]|jgi:hypothetical protein|nr:hypothetical protein [Brasilonema angustatum HA4187-MV1]